MKMRKGGKDIANTYYRCCMFPRLFSSVQDDATRSPSVLRSTSSGERGSLGMKLMVVLYAIGIIAVALPAVRSSWEPYFKKAKATFSEWTDWGAPPKRTADFERDRKRAESDARGKHVAGSSKAASGDQPPFWTSVFGVRSGDAAVSSAKPNVPGPGVPERAPEKALDTLDKTDKEQLDSLLSNIGANK